jgi:uncharacterized protein (AIM24 family)
MQYQIRKDPSYAMVEIELDDGSTVSLPEHVAATIRVE